MECAKNDWTSKFHGINDLRCERNGATTTLATQERRTSNEFRSERSIMRQIPGPAVSRLGIAR